MAAQLLLHPFSIRTSGRCATAEQGSDVYVESQLAVIVSTRLGERDMVPGFGVPDVAFSSLAAADIQTCLDTYGPDGVQITGIEVMDVNEALQAMTVEWAPE